MCSQALAGRLERNSDVQSITVGYGMFTQIIFSLLSDICLYMPCQYEHSH